MDTLEARIKALVDSGQLTFDGAKQRHRLPGEAAGILAMEGIKWAQETGEPRAACITKACAIYWRMYDER